MSGSKKLYKNITEHMKQVLNRDMTVLELACGTGLLSVKIAPMVKHLEATDFSEKMIEQAKKSLTPQNCIFLCRMQRRFLMPLKPLTQ